MGGGQSTEVPGGGSEGYHVLKVLENSPAHRAGLEAYFDFIVSIDGIRLNQENDMLKQILQKYVDQQVKVVVFNSKSKSIREVMLVPSNTWGGQGLLGVSIRFCSFEGAAENVWHVLEVHPNSPAAQAGLKPHSDYILGSDAMSAEDDLFTFVENNNNKQVRLYVYNSDTEALRDVLLTPNSGWGGEGSLGCGIGFGYLHRIPIKEKTGQPQDPEMGGQARGNTDGPAEGYADVPLSVPSQPGSPKGQPEQPPPAASSVTIENGVEALSLEDAPQVSTLPDSLTPAPSMVVRSTPQKQPVPSDVASPPIEGLPQQTLSPHGSGVSTATMPQTQPYQQMPLSSNAPTIHPSDSVPQHAVYSMAPPKATQSATLPGASAAIPHGVPVAGGHGYSQTTPTIQATPSYSAPQMTGVFPSSTPQATLSGLPTVPPTISFPSVAPTISFGPTPSLMSTANSAQ